MSQLTNNMNSVKREIYSIMRKSVSVNLRIKRLNI